MRIVACTAPEFAVALTGAGAVGQLLRVTNHLQCPTRGLRRDIDRVSILKALARLKVRHALSRIWNAGLSSEMALLADAVPRGPFEFLGIDDRHRHGLLLVSFTGAVATVAGNTFSQHSRRPLLVPRVRNRLRFSRMTQQTLQFFLSGRRRHTRFFIAGSNIPQVAIRV